MDKNKAKALTELKKMVRDGALVITQTDKSSRFAVLSTEQYLKAGAVHTSKDQVVDWKHVKYLQGQVNSHVWWLSRIIGYGKEKDRERMNKNTTNSSLELPAMRLLIKDHKEWSQDSGKPVPSRPVASGNRGINSHLSEIMSEFLEPLVSEMNSGEISSTEEALYMIENVNNKMIGGENLMGENALDILLDIDHSQVKYNYDSEVEFKRLLMSWDAWDVENQTQNLFLDHIFENVPKRKVRDPELYSHINEDIKMQTDCGTRATSLSSTCSEGNSNFSDFPPNINITDEGKEIELILASLLTENLKEQGRDINTDTLNQIRCGSAADTPHSVGEIVITSRQRPNKKQKLSPGPRKCARDDPSKYNKRKEKRKGCEGKMKQQLLGEFYTIKKNQGNDENDIRNKPFNKKNSNQLKEERLRREAETERTLNGSINKLFEASEHWSRWDAESVCRQTNKLTASKDDVECQSVQDFDKKPVFFGAVVCT